MVPDYVTSLEEVLAAFHQEHEREFAFSDKDQIVEIYGLRVTAIGTVPKPNFPQFAPTGSLQDAYKETRPVYFDGAYVETNVYYRDKIPVHAQLQGPAIVDQLDTTTVIPPGFTAEVDAYKNIIITVN